MIPLWLTPKVIKGGLLGIVVMTIFFTGFYIRGKLDNNRITKLQVALKVSKSNYDLCYENLQRSNDNWLELTGVVEETNAEVIRQGEEYKARVIQLRAMNREALMHLTASHNEAMRDMVAEANSLRELMQELSASEACHLAMEEIVK